MNARTALSIFVTLVVVGSTLAVPATAGAGGEPNLSVTVTDDTIDPGTVTTVELAIQNRGEIDYSSNGQLDQRVTTARGVTVEATADDGDPIEVRTPRQSIGSVRDGDLTRLPIRVAVDEDAEPGTYDVDVQLRYSHFRNYDTDGTITDRTVRRTVSVELEVRERARFDVRLLDADLSIGDSGPVTVSVTNEGDATAEDATLELSSENPALTFEGGESARTHLADLAPGKRRNVTVEGAVADGGERRNYSVAASVDYEDEDGVAASSDTHRFGVRPAPERSFAVEGVESDLRVDEQRTVSGELRNDGEVAVDNVVLRLETTNPNVNVDEPEIALGSLAPDETASFAFDVAVSDNAEPGDRQFTLTAEYRTQAGDRRESDPLDVPVTVAERRPVFEVTGVDARFTAGSSGTLEIQIRNARDEPLEDISAKLYTNAPLSSSDDEAFVQRLDPGETATVPFALQVSGNALPKAYPAQVDFQYDDADGDTHITDTYQVPVEVTEPENGGLPLFPIAAVLLLAIAGYAYYRRR